MSEEGRRGRSLGRESTEEEGEDGDKGSGPPDLPLLDSFPETPPSLGLPLRPCLGLYLPDTKPE